VNVPTVFVVARNAEYRPKRLAIEEDEAFVALANFRQVALRHGETAAVVGCHFDQGVEVAISAVQMKDTCTAATVQRLDNHFTTELVKKVLQTASSLVTRLGGIRVGKFSA